MTTSRGAGSAHNADAATENGAPAGFSVPAEKRSKGDRTEVEQAYLDALAADAEQAVKDTKRTIADLEKSLKDREAAAKTARANARAEQE